MLSLPGMSRSGSFTSNSGSLPLLPGNLQRFNARAGRGGARGDGGGTMPPASIAPHAYQESDVLLGVLNDVYDMLMPVIPVRGLPASVLRAFC